MCSVVCRLARVFSAILLDCRSPSPLLSSKAHPLLGSEDGLDALAIRLYSYCRQSNALALVVRIVLKHILPPQAAVRVGAFDGIAADANEGSARHELETLGGSGANMSKM